jgi:hypothetical protein
MDEATKQMQKPRDDYQHWARIYGPKVQRLLDPRTPVAEKRTIRLDIAFRVAMTLEDYMRKDLPTYPARLPREARDVEQEFGKWRAEALKVEAENASRIAVLMGSVLDLRMLGAERERALADRLVAFLRETHRVPGVLPDVPSKVTKWAGIVARDTVRLPTALRRA